MDKTAIKNFAIESRKILRESAIKKAGMYGITIDECSKPIQKGADFEVYKTIAGDEIRLYSKELKMRSNLVNVIKEKGFEQVIEETAYTWFNRLIAIRFMEVNDYLPTRVRVLSSETGSSTPDIVNHALDVDLNLSAEELDRIQAAKDDNRFDDAFQLLFVKQCNELNKILPGLFEATNDYMELLLDISYTSDGVVRMLVDDVSEDDFNVEKEGQVEIIGWLYQYYNTELKDDTFAKLKKNIKITKERIPAATQLFTPDWIVRYMVENSLGRVWIDHLRAVDESADEKNIAEGFGWKYYLPEAEQEENVAAELVKIRAERKDLKPQDISCIDPCCGSGHILVYMFDVLLQIYESEGISVRDAVFDILEKNIHGLDIDIRAYQLSYFALMMKGRGAAGRRFFRGVETDDGSNRPVQLNVYAIDESNDIDRNALSFLGKGMPEIEKTTAEAQVNRLLDEMTDAKEYGSIINVTDCDWKLVDRYLDSICADGQLTLGYVEAENNIRKMRAMFDIGIILSKKYETVTTNPPYMGNNGMSPKLTMYIKEKYATCKSDIYACFINRGLNLVSSIGYVSMITMESWMFLSSFEKMRTDILNNHTLNSLIHMPYLGKGGTSMGINFGTAAFVIFKRNISFYKGVFDYICYYETDDNGKPYEFPVINTRYNRAIINDFLKIPGAPVAYWLTDHSFNLFENEKSFGSIAATKSGLSTTDNNRFLRMWEEINYSSIGFNYVSLDDTADCKYRYIPHQKGGEYHKWYGNLDYVVDWYNNGAAIKKAAEGASGGRIVGSEYYLKEGLTWTDLTSTGKISVRFANRGTIFNSSGPMCFCYDMSNQNIVLGYLNSIVAREFLKLLAPTFHFNGGPISKLPFIDPGSYRNKINDLVNENIRLAKEDWDSFENSWDFVINPLIRNVCDIEEAYDIWERECNDRFTTLKCNEEELNNIYINLFGMNDELSSDVPDEDISVKKADLERDIKCLISYAVGCMFGRYSLAKPGLIYAGGDFDASLYGQYQVDDDAIIPITDEEYFDDDIVTRFVEFIRTVYGNTTLESNLNFIAKALGNKGNTSREVIRNYFLNDFFKDHCSTYSVTGSGKRPIYWLFDSGKQNGFKCLIYLHRYTPDTVGLIRSVYLKKAQDAIEASLKNAEYAIANTESAVDRAANTRKRDKYVKQLAEIKPYYQALSHIAMQRIDIDLDDGVKVNYAKFQGIEVGGEGEKKQTIDLLAKI